MTFFYKNPIDSPNSRTKERKVLIKYYKSYGIITLKKHVNVNHGIIAKTFKEMNSLVWGTRWRGNKWGKGSMCMTMLYNYFGVNYPFKKDDI